MKPTCELRVALWRFGNQQTIERLQQKYVAENGDYEWRNVPYWYMPTPYDFNKPGYDFTTTIGPTLSGV